VVAMMLLLVMVVELVVLVVLGKDMFGMELH
jgi:hypothetical protein